MRKGETELRHTLKKRHTLNGETERSNWTAYPLFWTGIAAELNRFAKNRKEVAFIKKKLSSTWSGPSSVISSFLKICLFVQISWKSIAEFDMIDVCTVYRCVSNFLLFEGDGFLYYASYVCNIITFYIIRLNWYFVWSILMMSNDRRTYRHL